MSKVKMPEPARIEFENGETVRHYTAAQMESYADARVREVLEAAARIAERHQRDNRQNEAADHERMMAGLEIAMAIRASIPPTPGETK